MKYFYLCHVKRRPVVGVGVVTCGCGGRKVDGEAGHEA